MLSRRDALAAGAAMAGSLVLPGARAAAASPSRPKGRVLQSVARWCYQRIPLPEFCRDVAAMGLPAIDLLTEEEWPVAADHGLLCSMAYGGAGTLTEGVNDKANHDGIVKALERSLPLAAAAKIPNMIVFFGNRRGLSDAEGIDNSIACLNRVKAAAEETGVTVCVELLNSKVDHKDYHGDRTPFGVEVIKAVDSPRVKLLYDIYHMQIMEGDIIRTIRDNQQYIAHYHTGGVPGRNELDDTQELQWATVTRAIADTGFTGYMAHEFIPTREPMASLREAVELCAV